MEKKTGFWSFLKDKREHDKKKEGNNVEGSVGSGGSGGSCSSKPKKKFGRVMLVETMSIDHNGDVTWKNTYTRKEITKLPSSVSDPSIHSSTLLASPLKSKSKSLRLRNSLPSDSAHSRAKSSSSTVTVSPPTSITTELKLKRSKTEESSKSSPKPRKFSLDCNSWNQAKRKQTSIGSSTSTCSDEEGLDEIISLSAALDQATLSSTSGL